MNKNSIKKPKFNTYWIYSLIVLFFVSTYFIGGNETNTTSKILILPALKDF